MQPIFSKQIVIDEFKKIKKSILLGAGGGVTDTAWMFDGNQHPSCETICDNIDSILIRLGEDNDDLMNETDEILTGGRCNEFS